MTQGYKTTEFWITIISIIVGLLVSTGVIDPNKSSQLTSSISALVGGIVTLAPAITYIINRTWLKSQNLTIK